MHNIPPTNGMLYLLSLQEVTDVPFRVVDEINQAMDPRNERMIFDRIIDQCQRKTDKGSLPPQYFVVTPKLLPNLNMSSCKNVVVHFVYNGFWMVPQSDMNWAAYG